MIFVLGISCLLLLYSSSVSHTVRLAETTSITRDSTFLPLETSQELMTDQLCRSVLRRAQSFRESLLKECEQLAGDRPVFKTFLEKTLAYLLWHNNATARTAPARRSLTWKCLKRGPGCGGYGDQIRGMAYAFILAFLTERMLYIQWPNLYTAKSDNVRNALEETMFVPYAINWSLPSFLSNVTGMHFNDHGSRYEAVGVCEALYGRTQHITYSTMHWHPSCFNETLMGNITASLALKEFIKSPRNVLECATTIIVRLLLKYSKVVQEKKKELKQILGIGPHTHFAAVHIRTGMFPSGLNEEVGRLEKSDSSWEKDIECAMSRSKTLGVTGPLILISDSIQCKQWAKKRFGKNVLINNVNPVHVSIDTKFRSQLSMNEKMQRYHSVLATTAEMALLSDAAVVFMAASGFSRVSTWLGGLSAGDKVCCNKLCNRYYHLVYH